MTAMTDPVVVCDGVIKIHRVRELEVVALAGVDLAVESGELVAIVGPSGAGKSSLLTLIAGLTSPSAGRVEVLGQDMGRLNERQRLRLRAQGIGIAAQNPERNLLPRGRVVDNLDFAQRESGRRRSDRRRISRELLALTRLEHHLQSPIYALSGGEQQRLSIAIALAGRPRLLLADEPTSQLDPYSRDATIALLRQARDQRDATVIVVTHDLEVGAAMDRSLVMRDGRLGAEQRAGEVFGVVAPDGSIQLPADLAERYPVGSRVRYVRAPAHIEIHPVAKGDDV